MTHGLFQTALFSVAFCALSLSACSNSSAPNQTLKEEQTLSSTESAPKSSVTPDPAMPLDAKSLTSQRMQSILGSQGETEKARYIYRNPEATLSFFEIQPGMTVAEILPGGGWYSKILLPFLGEDGSLVGIDYNIDMWQHFDGFANEQFLQKRKNWSQDWTETAIGWDIENTASVSAFAFGNPPKKLRRSVDSVLFIRALHHLTRFDEAYLTQAINDTKYILKPGGSVGIVQHRAAESAPNSWANGDNGYLKQSTVIKIMTDHGFELIETSEINANPKDKPAITDVVWRLPPTYGTSKDDPELKAQMEAIGESDRMTLKFRLKK